MDNLEELVENFNTSIENMFQDQRDILHNSNIVMASSVNDQAYLWYNGGGPIQFWRNYYSITENGRRRKLIPVVYIIGLPFAHWELDQKELTMKVSNGPAKLKYDRQKNETTV